MKLIKRYSYANEYETGNNKRRTVLGGIPNIIKSKGGDLQPLQNQLVDTGKASTVWEPKYAPGKVQFQNRGTNKYLTQIEAPTGEKLSVMIPAMPSATPIIMPDGISIKWEFPNGNIITKYVTEKGIKETVFQKAGEILKFRYETVGLDVVKKTGYLEFNSKTTGKLIFKTEAPYDVDTGLQITITIRKTGSVWDITYPSVNYDRIIDPVIVFGEGVGQIGGDHKDTYVDSNNQAISFGGGVTMASRINRHIALMRFSLIGHIPTNAIINSAMLRVVQSSLSAALKTISINPMVTNWGVTLTDEGATENPATGGQPTWRRSFDFNGVGGDVVWGGGGNISLLDWGAAINTFIILNAAAIGTEYITDITAGVVNDVLNDLTNYGYSLTSNSNTAQSFDTQESAAVGERPYLTVDYSIPSAPTHQSRISIPIGIGIM